MLKYAVLLESQATRQGASNPNKNFYLAFAKFFKAYSFVWYTERVGDIPASQAGNVNNLEPKFDTQHDVYKYSLALLDTANTLLGSYITSSNTGGTVASTGDIYGLTNLQWQKVINSYKLRVLISLSKRADDTADLGIKTQFATIVNNPATYPIMTSNADNIVYKFDGTYSLYPLKAQGLLPYAGNLNVSSTFLDLTTAAEDPRTFIAASPAPNLVPAGAPNIDFSSRFDLYVGADLNKDQGTLSSNASNYSFNNFPRYFASIGDGSTCESAIVMGYSELCFNVAEGINRGWATGNDGQWYLNGINASLNFYAAAPNGIPDGSTVKVYSYNGATLLGTATISFANFLSNVTYQGGAAGLTQILEQKYVAMWQNSGMEPFFNWRRTGVPAFAQGGSGIGTSNGLIPRRWKYDNNEIVGNPVNYNSAIQSQYGGTDDVTKDIWAIK
jgi:hypothetical protein